jgi:glyoxylase-like metal-dependent hydrolase (beta-lactamase superfamily II)
MEITELRPELHLIEFPAGQAYLWRDGTELTLIDTGLAGSEPELAAAITQLGHRRSDLRRVVLTHFHQDHVGSAAAVRGWGEVAVLAHEADAPVIRGEAPGPPAVLTEAEKPLYEQFAAGRPTPPPSPVDRELSHGDTVDFGGGALVIGAAGHTDGSIALHLPAHGVLFTGDLVANMFGQVTLGPFNTDREQAKASFVRLAQVDAQVVCFGHGAPLVDRGDDGAAPWRALCGLTGPDQVPDPLG